MRAGTNRAAQGYSPRHRCRVCAKLRPLPLLNEIRLQGRKKPQWECKDLDACWKDFMEHNRIKDGVSDD